MFGTGGCEEVWSSIFWAQRRGKLVGKQICTWYSINTVPNVPWTSTSSAAVWEKRRREPQNHCCCQTLTRNTPTHTNHTIMSLKFILPQPCLLRLVSRHMACSRTKWSH